MSQKEIKNKQRLCLKGLTVKEDSEGEVVVKGLVATTHPDRVGDILSENAIQQIVNHINDTSTAGGDNGAYRSVSLFHDWIKAEDPTLDEVGFLTPSAKKVRLNDGHYGAEVEAKLNKYYRGDMGLEEVKYRIENDQIAGFSIEYDTDDNEIKNVEYKGQQYRFIDKFTEFGGVGLARARMIANPHAVIYKEIVEKINNKEDNKMAEEEQPKVEEEPKQEEPKAEEPKEEAPAPVVEEPKEEPKAEEEKPVEEGEKKEEEKVEVKEINVKEIVEQVKEQALKELKVKNKPVKKTKEANTMEAKTPLSIKEMKESFSSGKVDSLRFKEAASKYFAENPQIDMQLKSTGIALNPTLQVKCEGTKLRIVGGLQTKDTLTQDTNAGAYTESIVEFADLFIPGLVETFNNQANLFGALQKKDHLMGGSFYGWKIKTDQADALSVDPDDPTVVFDPVGKLKLRTDIKEYRVGVSVTDYVLHHARATMGDLLMLEAEARMGDLMRDINDDLFSEQADGDGNKILGLEAVADSAGNTTLYGKTRSTANRLAPAAAGDTYTEVGGALTTAYLRIAYTKVETAGSLFQDLAIVMHPIQRRRLYELNASLQQLGQPAAFGFNVKGEQSWDGIPILIDSSCQTDAIFVIDKSSCYLVISRAPQLIGLAKVGAAESAYISVYLAAVYEQPRKIHMLNTLTAT